MASKLTWWGRRRRKKTLLKLFNPDGSRRGGHWAYLEDFQGAQQDFFTVRLARAWPQVGAYDCFEAYLDKQGRVTRAGFWPYDRPPYQPLNGLIGKQV